MVFGTYTLLGTWTLTGRQQHVTYVVFGLCFIIILHVLGVQVGFVLFSGGFVEMARNFYRNRVARVIQTAAPFSSALVSLIWSGLLDGIPIYGSNTE